MGNYFSSKIEYEIEEYSDKRIGYSKDNKTSAWEFLLDKNQDYYFTEKRCILIPQEYYLKK